LCDRGADEVENGDLAESSIGGVKPRRIGGGGDGNKASIGVEVEREFDGGFVIP
jgi:hypothetical protein